MLQSTMIEASQAPLIMMQLMAGEIDAAPPEQSEARMARASDIPHLARSAAPSGNFRGAGIFTRQDLRNIREYVQQGLSLPANLEGVYGLTGYKRCGVAGLEPEELLPLFQAIINHCKSWSPLESDVWNQNLALESSANAVVKYGEQIVRTIDAMPLMEKIRNNLQNLSDSNPGLLIYSAQDRALANAAQNLFGDLAAEIDNQLLKTQKLKTRINDFRIMLAGGRLSNASYFTGLEPQIQQKRTLLEKHKASLPESAFFAQINFIFERIGQAEREYHQAIQPLFNSLGSGYVSINYFLSMYSWHCSQLRDKVMSLHMELVMLIINFSAGQHLLNSIETLARRFVGIGLHMLDAEMAMNNIDFMWQSMRSQLEQSQQQFSSLNSELSLARFMPAFKRVYEPWRQIAELARNMQNQFW
ncbi:alpha-xenorhabdolysin family binary toxin subunit A [Massilia sp. W12]|uniref:alpha-xenorhabdolysin family binary toxin subunit A n=1 Tax=Massilia sp. W12 TaxID=3126507 RepID=UPI0030D321E6